MTAHTLTTEQIAEARKLLRGGSSFPGLARRYGVPIQTMRVAIDSAYRDRRMSRDRSQRYQQQMQERYETELDIRLRIANVEDAYARRDLTGRICGDPPKGRSALDQRRGA